MLYLFRKPKTLLAPVAVGSLLAACSALNSPMPAPPPVSASASAPAPATTPVPAAAVRPAPAPPAAAAPPAATALPAASAARTPLAYRRDAAAHLYTINADRIYKGMLQPNLYAVGVLDVDIDRQGQVVAINWRRAPSHVPEVMNEIVRTVRAAAPFPVPARLGKVTYTDIWLWDKSGKFQLDTLTEGQL